jgi:hypothetical protein
MCIFNLIRFAFENDKIFVFFFFRPLTGEVAEAIGTSFAAETNRRDEDAEM